MEVRDEELDKEKGMRNTTTTATTLDYNSPNRDSSPVGSEKLSHGNPIILNPSPHQTLAVFPHNQYNLSYRPISKPRSRSTRDHHHNQGSSPDPVTTVSPTSTTPVASGSHLKTTATATAPASAAVEGGVVVVPVSSPPTRYRECLKNHAASSGRHVLDGCGEFMPSGEEGSADALKCAACDCHRNFHRKEIDGGESQYVPGYKDINRRNSIVLPPQHYHHLHHQPPHPHHHSFALHGLSSTPATGAGLIPPVMMAFGGGGGLAAESSSEDLNVFQSNYGGGIGIRGQQSSGAAGNSSKKRFRTKFNQEQKEKMMEFAEKLGWRIQKHDEQEVQVFCSDVGVKRQVFKVWMHNNKQAMKKKEM